ncbi:MAG: 30S ribosome-binding factor RbfA [Terrimicrobiaceae bacterium]|nr:30S ribosome-binding factor RbfA [Terrimicrobiaceae bacterium]
MKHRLERVCEVLKRELGVILLREIDFAPILVTISSVDVTPDLKQAHVYVSALGNPGQQRQVLEKLEHNRVHLQGEMAKRVTLKHTPHLFFKLDEAIERGSRVLNIMNELGLDDGADV